MTPPERLSLVLKTTANRLALDEWYQVLALHLMYGHHKSQGSIDRLCGACDLAALSAKLTGRARQKVAHHRHKTEYSFFTLLSSACVFACQPSADNKIAPPMDAVTCMSFARNNNIEKGVPVSSAHE